MATDLAGLVAARDEIMRLQADLKTKIDGYNKRLLEVFGANEEDRLKLDLLALQLKIQSHAKTEATKTQ